MKKVRLGRTGLFVTQISFGGIPIQTVSRQEAVATVRHCFERGINFYDTAQAYTTSESIVGEALEGVRDKVYFATKSGGRDVATVEMHLNNSLEQLRTSYIDVYQLHNVVGDETLEKLIAPGGVLDYVREEQKRGRIKHIGVTSHRLDTILKALCTDHFATIQFPFNYIENDAGQELFPLARKMDVGIIVMKPIAGGVMPSPAASLRWIANQTVDVVIPGMENTALVDKNLAALELPLSEQDVKELDHIAQELGPVFCRRCGYCMPCPNGIPVNFIASAEIFFNRSGWHRLTKDHIEGFKKGVLCAKCKLCETRCPYNLPLSRLVPENSARLLARCKNQDLKV